MTEHPDDPWFQTVPEAEVWQAVGPDRPDNPVTVGIAFYRALAAVGGPDVKALKEMVTPWNRRRWRFPEARDLLAGRSLSTSVEVASPDVVYLKFCPGMSVPGRIPTGAPSVQLEGAYLTLVRNPRWEGWRVHQLGQKAAPEDVPAET